MVRARVGAAALAAALVSPAFVAAQSQPLASVPPNLPLRVRSVLETQRGKIAEQIRLHNLKIADFLPRCGPGKIPATDTQRVAACAKEHQALLAEQRAMQASKDALVADIAAAAAVPCASSVAQVERDTEAIAILSRAMAVNVDELRTWETLGRDTRNEAILAGVSLLTGGLAKSLIAKEKALGDVYVELTRNGMSSLLTPGAANAQLRRYLDAAYQEYRAAEMAARLGSLGDKSLETLELFKHLTTYMVSIAQANGRGDRNLRDLVNDPTVRSHASTATRAALDLLSTVNEFNPAVQKWGPHYAVGAYVADMRTSWKTWKLAFAQVDQQYGVIGNEAQAMRALQLQLQRSTQRLNACRAGHG